MTQYCIGVDEVGRGPLAGPVTVGAVCVPHTFDWQTLPGVKDSKQLSENVREEIYRDACVLKRAGQILFTTASVGPATIDRIGITRAVSLAIERAISRVTTDPEATEVLLDGLLAAPQRFTQQRTITGGDGKEPIIGLASIVAKVTRDRYMVRLDAREPYGEYGFASHKGYGTKAHRAALQEHGLSDMHRRSYCRQLIA